MKRHEIINYIIEKKNYLSYLEIGYGNGDCFHNVNAENKTGIDKGIGTPKGDPYVIRKDSRLFFSDLKKSPTYYDIIFIDGSHLAEDVEEDISDSLSSLNVGGTIVMHDCNPPSEPWQLRDQSPLVGGWCGDTWKAFVKLKATRNDLWMGVVDSDYGCGIIEKGKQELVKVPNELNYSLLKTERKKLLNLMSIEEFKQKYNP